jgi:DNA-binding transcriptional ArsR family regulator
MSRIGVMKHLRILEDAGLITTRKHGRERLHYLNPAPIYAVADWATDWVEQYRRFRVASFDRLETYLRQVQTEALKPTTRGFAIPTPAAEESEKEK